MCHECAADDGEAIVNEQEQVVALTAKQAAQRLGISPKTLRHLVATGQLPGAYIGNQVRVDSRAIDELLGVGQTHRCRA